MDSIIPHDFNHPSVHKISAIKYLVNRLTNYPLSDTHKYTEYSTIKHILHDNKYNPTIRDQLAPTNQYKPHAQTELSIVRKNNKERKWATFTYTGYEGEGRTAVLPSPS